MMKTKSFLMIICLFACTALMSLFAQKADRTDNTWKKSSFFTWVYCDGTMVDIVEGEVHLHMTFHYDKKGELIWEKWHFKGTVTGYFGENFKLMDFEKYDASTAVLNWRYHLKGDQGSHYIGTLSYNYATGAFSVGKTVCH